MNARRDRITDEAALWLVRAREPALSAREREEFASWLAGSAEHVQEYLSLLAIASDIRELPATVDVDALLEMARQSRNRDNVITMDASATPTVPEARRPGAGSPPRGFGRRVVWGTAAAILIGLVSSLYLITTIGSAGYTTGIGEQVSFPLEDGSVVTLNAQSALEVDYNEHERGVRLLRGEALFDVAKDSERPFRVLADRALIEAVGTQFNVRSRGDDTTVTVLEGIVEVRAAANRPAMTAAGSRTATQTVPEMPAKSDTAGQVSSRKRTPEMSPVRLTVGQQARVSLGDVAVEETNLDKVTAWRERRLVFEAMALADVVREFNLYNEQRIVIQDAALAEQSISGAFSADDRASFALFLDEAGLAVAETRADGTIVLGHPGDR